MKHLRGMVGLGIFMVGLLMNLFNIAKNMSWFILGIGAGMIVTEGWGK